MRQPATVERLYLDFDGFFATVHQQVSPPLRGRPVGVLAYLSNSPRTCIIACSSEAKAAGCRSIMTAAEARAICPDIILVPQRPDLYRRAHAALTAEIECVIPIDEIKSIDELTCRLDAKDILDPAALAGRIKDRLRREIGAFITCSIGFAANRLLAKMACKVGKPDGCTIWTPQIMPAPLLTISLEDVPGIGGRMQSRLLAAGIASVETLLATSPKQLRKLWGNVSGERLWYALHGYDLQSTPSERSMYGHGRALPPSSRCPESARDCSRLLLAKAARRMRRDGYAAQELHLSVEHRGGHLSLRIDLPAVVDDLTVLDRLNVLWKRLAKIQPAADPIYRVGVALGDLVSLASMQRDLFFDQSRGRAQSERLTEAVDALNHKFGERVVTFGAWQAPPGGFAGGKISYTRIPSAEDFW